MNKTYQAVSSLIGTIIGVGIFALPFVVAKIGFWAGIFYLFFLGGLNLITNLIYGELILRTPGDHQLTGYVNIYLGKKGKVFATLALFLSLYGALLAYLIKIGEFLTLIFKGEPLVWSLIFFTIAFLIILLGIKTVAIFEGFSVFGLLLLILVLGFVGFPEINVLNFASPTNLSYFFLPFGVILFALAGSSVIPEMEEILREEPQNLKKAIFWGSTIPVFIYLFFVIVVMGISGSATSDDAISGLIGYLPEWIIVLGAGIGVLAIITSYLTLGYVLEEVWFRDFKIKRPFSVVLASFPALFLFLVGAKSFVAVLEFSGAISGGIIGILILSAFEKAKKLGKREPVYIIKVPKLFLFLFYLIFFLGIFFPFFQQ